MAACREVSKRFIHGNQSGLVLGTSGAKIPVFDTTEPGAEIDNVGLQFITIPTGSGVTLMPMGTKYADFANCHNYVEPSVDNYAWDNAFPNEPDDSGEHSDTMLGEYFGVTWWKQFTALALVRLQSRWCRQNLGGAPTASILTPVTQDQQGKLVLTQYLAQFARGWDIPSSMSYATTMAAITVLGCLTERRPTLRAICSEPDSDPCRRQFLLHAGDSRIRNSICARDRAQPAHATQQRQLRAGGYGMRGRLEKGATASSLIFPAEPMER